MTTTLVTYTPRALSPASYTAYTQVLDRLSREFSGDKLIEKAQDLHLAALTKRVSEAADAVGQIVQYQHLRTNMDEIATREAVMLAAMDDLRELLELRVEARVAVIAAELAEVES